MKIIEVEFEELKEKEAGNEGFVILGTGGDLQEWVNGITDIFRDEEVIVESDNNKVWKDAYKLETTGARIDTALIPNEGMIDWGRLAILRIHMHSQIPNSWFSDYIVNYAEHHNERGF